MRNMGGHLFAKRRPGGDQKKLGMSLTKFEFWLDVCDCRNESDGKMTENYRKGEILRRVVACGQPRGRAIMAERRRRKTRSGEKDEDDNRARLMNRARRMNLKMRRNHLTLEGRRRSFLTASVFVMPVTQRPVHA